MDIDTLQGSLSEENCTEYFEFFSWGEPYATLFKIVADHRALFHKSYVVEGMISSGTNKQLDVAPGICDDS